MPFKSKSQVRWMYANKPKMAKRWSDETPDHKSLPEKRGAIDSQVFESCVSELSKIAAGYGTAEGRQATEARTKGFWRTAGPGLAGVIAGTALSKKYIKKAPDLLHVAMGGVAGAAAGLGGAGVNLVRELRKEAGLGSAIKSTGAEALNLGRSVMLPLSTTASMGAGLHLSHRSMQKKRGKKFTPSKRMAKQELVARGAALGGASVPAAIMLAQHFKKIKKLR